MAAMSNGSEASGFNYQKGKEYGFVLYERHGGSHPWRIG
jgi:hypothetical protein